MELKKSQVVVRNISNYLEKIYLQASALLQGYSSSLLQKEYTPIAGRVSHELFQNNPSPIPISSTSRFPLKTVRFSLTSKIDKRQLDLPSPTSPHSLENSPFPTGNAIKKIKLSCINEQIQEENEGK